MKNKIQYEVGFQIKASAVESELARSLLAVSGFDLSELVEQDDKKGIRYSFYIRSNDTAKRMLSRIRTLKLRGARPFLKKHFEKDWSSEWKKGWRPFALTKRFQVIPLWQVKRTCPKRKEPIFLETTNAFGTGLHETTRFVARLIEGLTGKFDSFLDVGTGTGILAIVALKRGAGRVVAFDNDPAAVRVARENLKVNGLACRILVADVKGYRPAKPFDLVAANLVSPDLIEFRDRIVSFVKSGGALVISGVSLQNISRVRRAFMLPALKLVTVIRGKEWAALLFKVKDKG